MSELMPCQMCGGKAFFNDELLSATTWGYWCQCQDCSCRSGIEHSDIGDGEADALVRSSRLWNEMQTLIGGGKLLDAMPASKGGRL